MSYHDFWVSDLIFQELNISGEMSTTTLFITFKQEDNFRVRNAQDLEGLDDPDTGKDAIAIIRNTSSIGLVTLNDGLNGAEAFFPASHMRLLIIMTLNSGKKRFNFSLFKGSKGYSL